ncbi:MAG TPA: glycosyltransferase [Chitinivibrionales bacterium]
MIHVAFLNQYFLVQKEVIGALKRLPGVRVVVIDIADFPGPIQAEKVCRALDQTHCTLVVTINEWGLDAGGIMVEHFKKKSIFHVNWCVDDPFFMEIFHNHLLTSTSNRLDFVSNRAYATALRDRGLTAHFLPLAADPSQFFPLAGRTRYVRSCCFVGNSYRKQIDEFCAGNGPFLESLVPFMGNLLKEYETDLNFNIENQIHKKLAGMDLPQTLPSAKAVFIVKHFISYLFRKNLVRSLARRYQDFMVFGDEHWLCDVPKEQVCLTVRYYGNLNETYSGTAINIDINRVVITEGFTQRIFDCLAGGNFIITSQKPIVAEFFQTKGEGQEMVVFENEAHCKDLIDYFIKHEDERLAIASRGMRCVLARHTYEHRIGSMFGVLADHLGKGMLH